MSAREEILGRVRDAIAGTAEPPPVPRAYRRSLGLDHDATLDLFAETVADYRATVRRVAPDELPVAVAAALAEQGARRVAVPPGLPADWLPADVEAVRDDGSLTAADLDTVDGVVTTASVGIAATGTLVLDGGETDGRRLLTLVPDYHLCVVDSPDVVGSVPEALERVGADRPVTLVSGPSATSDIELNRVEGVHGPRTLVVLLVVT